MSPSRRRCLALVAGTASLAGCGEAPAGFGSDAETGTPTYPAVLATAPLGTAGTETPATSTETFDAGRVVVAADLPPAEYRIVETAVTEGAYRTCHPPDAFGSLTRRFGHDGYLRFDGSLYGVYIAAADEVQLHTGDAGAPLPDC